MALTSTNLTSLPKIAEGKVRDLYEIDKSTLLFVATDRISAYDVIMDNVSSQIKNCRLQFARSQSNILPGRPSQGRTSHAPLRTLVQGSSVSNTLSTYTLPQPRPTFLDIFLRCFQRFPKAPLYASAPTKDLPNRSNCPRIYHRFSMEGVPEKWHSAHARR